MAIHNREFDDERCKNCSVNAKCLACDVYLKSDNIPIMIVNSLRCLYPLQDFEVKAINEVVDKLTPKRLLGVIEGYGDRQEIIYKCPSCKTDLSLYDENKLNYCPKCGQKIYVD